MKRLLLPFLGLLLFSAAPRALAIDCSTLETVNPVSTDYVIPVLQRADDGIAYAEEAATNEDFFTFYAAWWARSIGGTFAQLIDSRERLAVRASDLTKVTACQRFDELLIECKIDDVRSALAEASERGSFVAIMRLQSILLFLQERLAHLAAGGLDSGYADPSWGRVRTFDREAPPKREEPLCPFHSDYTAPRMTGYGCDATVMETILSVTGEDALPFMKAELDGLREIERQIDSFREIVPLLQQLSSEEDVEPPAPLGEREHKTIMGCTESLGVCSDNPAIRCASDEACFLEDAGSCTLGDEALLPKRSLRGWFSFPKEHLDLLVDFVHARIQDGLSRTFPDEWALTEDILEGSEAREERRFDDGLMRSARDTYRVVFRTVSGIQGRLEGGIFAEATDAELEIATSLSDVRASIGELARLTVEKTGVRSFVNEIAYFLRRSCIFRPCQASLEQVIKTGLQDECFPYTNGQFLEDTSEDPRWEKCVEAANIQIQ